MVTARAVVLAYFLEGDWTPLAKEATSYASAAAAWHSSVGIVAAAIAALATSRAGKAAEARTLLQHVTSLLERVAPTMYAHSVAVVVAATAVWDLEAREHAATYRRLALDLLLAAAGDTGFGPFELHVARMSALLGDASQAQDYFERARRKLDAHGYTHMRAILDYDQAGTLMRAGATDWAQIITLLDAALESFHAHGMLGWAARAAAQKQALATTLRSSQPTDRQHPTGMTAYCTNHRRIA